MVQLLCVAEKPSVALAATKILSNNRFETKQTKAKHINLYKFDNQFQGQDVTVAFTSTHGHALRPNFPEGFIQSLPRNDNSKIFDCPINWEIEKGCKGLIQNIQSLAKKSFGVFLWLDNDREGEGIADEVEQICKEVHPTIKVYRARFPSLDSNDIIHAFKYPDQVNKNDVLACRLRAEMDFRTGVAFTRFQYQFKGILQDDGETISYGPCQFPTLGFVVKAFLENKKHKPEKFYKIECAIQKNKQTVSLLWDRKRLFCETSTFAIYQSMLENPVVEVVNVTEKTSASKKPLPLTTIKLLSSCAQYFDISGKKAMKAAERLYQKGFISYPRTETDSFAADFNFQDLVNNLSKCDGEIGKYAKSLQIDTPRSGKLTDNAHPPIYPLKAKRYDFGDEIMDKVFDFVCRHFLASISRDGIYMQTSVNFDVGGEQFHLEGARIVDQGWHLIYPWKPFKVKEIPKFDEGEKFEPKFIQMNPGETTAPCLLTEAQLLKTLNKNGIGTDATFQDHIDKIKKRKYIVKKLKAYAPTPLGMALYAAYNRMGFEFMDPTLRAELESDLKAIQHGDEDFREVYSRHVTKYRDLYHVAVKNKKILSEEFEKGKENPYNAPEPRKTKKTKEESESSESEDERPAKRSKSVDKSTNKSTKTERNKSENKSEDSRKERNKSEDYRKERNKSEDSRKERNKSEDYRKERNKSEDYRKERNKSEDSRKERNKSEDSRKERNKSEDSRKERNNYKTYKHETPRDDKRNKSGNYRKDRNKSKNP